MPLFEAPTVLLPQLQEAYTRDPRTKLVQAMLEQGSKSLETPTYNIGSTLAKALSAGLGGLSQGLLSKSYQEQNTDALKGIQDSIAGMTAPPSGGPTNANAAGLPQGYGAMNDMISSLAKNPATASQALSLATTLGVNQQNARAQLVNSLLEKGKTIGADGQIGVAPGELGTTAALAKAQSGGQAEGKAPWDVWTAGKTAAIDVKKALDIAGGTSVIDIKKATDLANAQYLREYGTNAPATTPPSAAPTGVAAPSMAPAQSASLQSGAGITTPLQTDKGTAVPPISQQTLEAGSKNIDQQIARSTKVQENWDAVRPTVEQGINRLTALGKVFQQVQAGGLTTNKAEIQNVLEGAGLKPVADRVMSSPDAAKTQEALWLGMQDVLSTLKTINQGTGGRILNSEFNTFFEHGFNPNMKPDTLHSAVTKQLGQMYQVQNMIDDWYGAAKPAGWRDAAQYQSQYFTQPQNSLDNHVKYAESVMGPFKGMTAPNVQAPLPDIEAEMRKRGLLK